MILKQEWGAALVMSAAVAVATASMAVEPAGPLSTGAAFELFTASEAAAWNSAHRRGATLAVTEMQPEPPWAL